MNMNISSKNIILSLYLGLFPEVYGFELTGISACLSSEMDNSLVIELHN